MQLSKLNYEKLLAAAVHAKAETDRANTSSKALITVGSRLEDLERTHEGCHKLIKALVIKNEIRDEALVQLALRLSFHGDAEPIAGTE